MSYFFDFKKILILFSFFTVFLFFSQSVIAFDIIETETVTISASVPGIVLPPDTTSGGGSYSPIVIPETAVRFSGYAYPYAKVSISKQGQEVLFVNADKDAFFSATLEEKFDETILYSVFATDLNQNRSLLLNYPLVVSKGYITHLSGILFAPTISLDKSEVVEGGFLNVSGYARPEKEIEIFIKGINEKVFTLSSLEDGRYSINIPLRGLPKGEYVISLKYKNDSRFSKSIKFLIGEKDVFNLKDFFDIPGDCNRDNVINLVDFSVLAFWYKRDNPPICVDVNKDNIVNLVDFSIVAYYWTG